MKFESVSSLWLSKTACFHLETNRMSFTVKKTATMLKNYHRRIGHFLRIMSFFFIQTLVNDAWAWYQSKWVYLSDFQRGSRLTKEFQHHGCRRSAFQQAWLICLLLWYRSSLCWRLYSKEAKTHCSHFNVTLFFFFFFLQYSHNRTGQISYPDWNV